jgi:signal transduction histidine kinase
MEIARNVDITKSLDSVIEMLGRSFIANFRTSSLEQQQFILDLIETSKIPLFIKSSTGKYLLVNSAFCELADKPNKEIFGTQGYSCLPISSPNCVSPDEHILMLGTYTQEVSLHRPEERDSCYIFKRSVLDCGKNQYIAGGLQDITPYINLSQQYETLEKKLLRAQKMECVGSLAAAVAHDLNNLLTVILGSTEMIRVEGALTEDSNVSDYLSSLVGAATRSSKIVRELLRYSRNEAAAQTKSNPSKVIYDLSGMIKILFEKSISLETMCYATENVLAEDAEIESMVMNLAINAKDAMPQGGLVRIATNSAYLDQMRTAKHNVQPGRYVRISVQDNGTGMPEHVQKHVFEPYFTTKPAGKGTGLGLSTIQELVSKRRGFIELKSELGKGSCFQIYLPVALNGHAANTGQYEMDLGIAAARSDACAGSLIA